MAVQVKAKGNGPSTGTPKTPAPTRKAPPNAVTSIRAPTPQGYGENGPHANASRTNPGEFVELDLGANMRELMDDDGALSSVIAKGVSLDLGWQTRAIGDKNVPTHPAMKRQTTPSKVGDVVVGSLPATCGASAAKDPTDPNA